MNRKESVRRWLWYFSIPAATILLYKLSDNLGQAIGVIGTLIKILAPFVGGFILAFFLYGPSSWLENRLLKLKGKAWPKLARPLALTVVYLLLFGLLALLVYLVIPVLISSITDLAGALPGYLAAAQDKLQDSMAPEGLFGQLQLSDRLTDVYESLIDTLNRLVTTENILNAIKGVGNVAASLFDVVIAFIVSMYMLGGREHLFKAVRNFCSLFIKRRPMAILRQYSRLPSPAVSFSSESYLFSA